MKSVGKLSDYVVYTDNQYLSYGTQKKRIYRRYEFNSRIPNDLTQIQILQEIKECFNNGTYDGYPIYEASISFSFLNEDPTVIDGIHITVKEKNYDNLDYLLNLGNNLNTAGFDEIFVIIWTKTRKGWGCSQSSWRKQVVKDKKCICCNGDKKLEAHHIFAKKNYPSLERDLENGVALCHWCHKKYHSYYGVDSTPNSLIEFLHKFGDL